MGGRLGLYRYMDMHHVVDAALQAVREEMKVNDNEVRNRVSSKEDNERKEGESIMKWKQFV